jgi:hypothetical protein
VNAGVAYNESARMILSACGSQHMVVSTVPLAPMISMSEIVGMLTS